MHSAKIVYPECPIQGHAKQPLNRICIDQKYTKRGLVCCICEFQTHQALKVIPVKTFLQNMKAQADLDQKLNPLEFEQQLIQLRNKYFTSISQCRQFVLDQLQALQNKGHLFFNNCQDSLIALAALNQPISNLTKEGSTRQFKAFFNRVLQLYAPQDAKGFSLHKKFTSLLKKTKQSTAKMEEGLNTMQQAVKKSCKGIAESFSGSAKAGLQMMAWSQTLKGLKIKITGSLIQQGGMQSSGQRFGLMEQPLPQRIQVFQYKLRQQCLYQEGKTCWGMRVKKFVGWVGVGICLRKSIKDAHFHFNYTNIGHGSYLISTNGYSWSHSVKEFNSASKTFHFTVNDIVYIEYDPEQNKLRYKDRIYRYISHR